MACSMVMGFTFSIRQMNLVSVSMPILDTLETGKMGQMFPDDISSPTLICSFSAVFSVISMGNLFNSLCFSNFFS